MNKYIVGGVVIIALIASFIGLIRLTIKQSDLINAQELKINELKNINENIVKSYEDDIKIRESNNANRRILVRNIAKEVQDEQCINRVIDKRIVDKLQQREATKSNSEMYNPK